MPDLRERLATLAAGLAERGVRIGTSSWKYEGWLGMLYDEQRYLTRNRFSQAKFNRACLAEYAEVFKTVCVDAGYYQFPSERYIEGLVAQVPGDFRFGFKVTEEITIRRFPKLPRHGSRGGELNPNFLNAGMFAEAFLKPLEAHRGQIGVLMFEFSPFHPGDFERGRDFVEQLDAFLGALPGGWQYGVEIRNKSFLQPAYFETLARHNVAHVYNSWDRMSPVDEQAGLPGSRTADFTAARFLLRPGRRYQQAVDRFSPYDTLGETYPEGREALRRLVRQAAAEERPPAQRQQRPSQVFVNNRLEGNALLTLAESLDAA